MSGAASGDLAVRAGTPEAARGLLLRWLWPVVARCPAPHPTNLGKDASMHVMTLHAQADLWQHGAVTLAALFMEGEMRSPDNEAERTDVLLYAVMNRGLRVATDLPRLALGPRPGWAIHLNPAGALTLTWPHVRPLLLEAPLNLPTGWREAAAEHDLVLLFVGDRLGLREHTEDDRANPGQRSSQAAERGELAAGAIAYSYLRQQQESRPARPTDLPPRSRADRWTARAVHSRRHLRRTAAASATQSHGSASTLDPPAVISS